MVDGARRPIGVLALSVFFAVGAVISFISAVSLVFPGGPLEPMWRLNPDARAALAGMGSWAVVLMTTVSIACSLSAIGLWRGAPWGLRFAVVVLVVNAVGDLANAILREDPRTLVGLPIAGAMILYLISRRRGRFFAARR